MSSAVERFLSLLDACLATRWSTMLTTLATSSRERAGVGAASIAARRARAALGTGEARELLEEAVGAGAIGEAEHGAILAHLAEISTSEVLARRALTLARTADAGLVVDGEERSAGEYVVELRQPPRPKERATVDALDRHFGHDRAARRDALAEAEERGARILDRGPKGPDDAPADTLPRCERFLAATEDAAKELVERVRYGSGETGAGLLSLARALSPRALDPLFKPTTRARRLGALFTALGLEGVLGRAVRVEPSRLASVEPLVVTHRRRALVLTPALELGLASERAMLAALGQSAVLTLVSPATSFVHAHPTLGTTARTLGLVLAGSLGERAVVARLYDAGGRQLEAFQTLGACAALLEARASSARALVRETGERADEEARHRVAAAWVVEPGEVPLELARPLRDGQRAELAEARARLASFALVPCLRERYDADFLRNPRLADFLRGASARGDLLSAEALLLEAGGSPDADVTRALELVR